MKKITKCISIIIISIIVSILGIGRMPQLIVIFGLCAGSINFILRRIDKKMQKRVIALLLTVFLLQVMISLFLYNQTVDTKYYGFSFKGDDYSYGDFGTIVGFSSRILEPER